MHQSPAANGRSRGVTSSSICILLFAAVVLQSIQPRLALPTRFRREVADQPDASQQAAADVDPSAADPGRKDRSLSFFDNFINMAAAGLGGMAGSDGGGGLAGDIVGALGGNLGGGFGGGGGAYENEADVDLYNEAISRTIPRRKIAGGYGGQQFGGPSYSNSPAYSNSPGYSNSPVYYIRMPPSPYVFVPGLGYVSPPPSMPNNPLGNYQPPLPQSPFVNLPLEYVSNAKPSGVYTWGMKKPRPSKPSKTQTTPKPYQKPTSSTKPTAVSKPQYAWPQPSIKPLNQFDSPVTNLQGQYTFNGRPSGLYVLKNPFSSFYSDVLQSFYP